MRKTASTVTREERRADRVVTSNRRATHDYFIDDMIEAGIALQGTEIKSIREAESESPRRTPGSTMASFG